MKSSEFDDIELEYVGFWARVGASIIDTLLMGIIILPVVTAVYGAGYWLDGGLIKGPVDFLLNWVFPAVAIILFWMAKQATPGKMALLPVLLIRRPARNLAKAN